MAEKSVSVLPWELPKVDSRRRKTFLPLQRREFARGGGGGETQRKREEERRNAGNAVWCGSGMGMNEDERHPQPPTEV